MKLWTWLALALLVVSPAHAQSPARGLAPADILRFATVSDAQISPDAERVVYQVITAEGRGNLTTLWITRTGSELLRPPPVRPMEPRESIARRFASFPLLPSGWSASNPRWSPDGRRIAFLSTHESQSGLWVVSPENRLPRFVAAIQNTNFFITYEGETFAWSPDSRSIAYISATREPAVTADDDDDDPRVIDRIQYKSRTSFSDRLRTHVWIADVDNPEPRQLTSGQFYDHALSFSPTGNEIAFISNHEVDPDANNNSDIFTVDLRGQVRQLTNTNGCEYEPVWSPDGKWIAYIATKRDVTTIDSVAEDGHVWILDVVNGGGRDLTAEQDRRAHSPQWSPESDTVFFLAGDRGSTLVYSVSVRDPKVKPVLPDYRDGERLIWAGGDFGVQPVRNRYQVTSFTVAQRKSSKSGQPVTDPAFAWPLAFTLSAPSQPGEVWFRGTPAMARRVTGANSTSSQYSFVEPEELAYKSVDGFALQGWLVKPANWRPDRKFPLILAIHGGPHGMYGYAFNPTFQVYAARGYAVLYLNPRGSSGYGQRFSDGTINQWGGEDYRDLMQGVDEALKRYPWLDGNRMGVTGGSYGGFMTNWIITQTSRFRAAVSVASLSNLISFYSTSLYQDLIHAEFGGFPWDNYELLWQWSPIHYVRQAQTPTLFIHGEQDNDVHITQAEEMYMGLKRRGIETVFVRYPREGHGLREPRHRVDALERTLAWFDRFVR